MAQLLSCQLYLKLLRIIETMPNVLLQTLFYKSGPLTQHHLNSGSDHSQWENIWHCRWIFWHLKINLFCCKRDWWVNGGEVVLSDKGKCQRITDNRTHFSKNQKAIKLNNVSFGHICDKKHIFKSLRMIDKDKLPDCKSCALKAGAEIHELI